MKVCERAINLDDPDVLDGVVSHVQHPALLTKGFSPKATGTKAGTNFSPQAIGTKACTRLSGLGTEPISPPASGLVRYLSPRNPRA